MLSIKEIYPIHERFLHDPFMEHTFILDGLRLAENQISKAKNEIDRINKSTLTYMAFVNTDQSRCFSLMAIKSDKSGTLIDMGQYLTENFS